MQTCKTNNKGDIGTFKVLLVGYFGTSWMSLNEELQVQMSACLPDMGSNANAFKCILNTFRKYLKISNVKYLHLKKKFKYFSNTFKYILQIVFILWVTEFAFSFFF